MNTIIELFQHSLLICTVVSNSSLSLQPSIGKCRGCTKPSSVCGTAASELETVLKSLHRATIVLYIFLLHADVCVKQRLAALSFSTALMRRYALSEIYSGVSGVERSFLSLERIVPAGLPVVSVLEARHTVPISPGGVLRRKLNFIRKQTIGLKSQIINIHCESVWSLVARYHLILFLSI